MTDMQVIVIEDDRARAELEIAIKYNNECKDLTSECKLFGNTIICQILVTFPTDNKLKIFVQLKDIKGDGVIKLYTLFLTLYTREYKVDVVLKANSNEWQLIGECKKSTMLCLFLEPGKCVPFKELYDDTTLTDFKLYGESDNTGVSFHRHVLGFSSPVLKSMLLGDWKETRQGKVQLAFISKNTLQHLKEYIYLKNVPNLLIECAELLCLANYYMLNQLPELERSVEIKLRKSITFKDFWPWFEFSVNHKNTRLLVIWLAVQTSIQEIGYNFKGGPHDALFKLKSKTSSSEYYNLYDDKDFVDFELRTGDNIMYTSVDVHRSVMAAFSPVLKALFQNEWKDAKYGYIQLNEISKQTLQHFKDFIYQQKLPDDSIDCSKLITLAAYYKIPDLEKEAALKIAYNLTTENIWEWLEYCVEHKHEYLLVAMLKNIYEHDKIDSIKDYLSKL